MKTAKAALMAALITGGSAVLLDMAAFAQIPRGSRVQQQQPQQQQPQQQVQGQREYNLSRAERTALAPLLQALESQDWNAVQAALPAAQEAARGADARYVVAQVQLRLGLETQNVQVQSQAVDAMIDSGGATAEELPRLIENQIRFAQEAGDTAKADRALNRLAELDPNNPNAILRMAQARAERGDAAGAIEQYRRAFQQRESSGQAVPEDWRKVVLATAYRARLPQTLDLARELVEAYPNPGNWRDALAIYRELSNPEQSLHLDFYRLMGAVGVLTSERDFIEYAEAARRGAIFGEVKTALEQGLAGNAITGNAAYAREMLDSANGRIAEDRTSLPEEKARALAGSNGQSAMRVGDAYYGYGNYAEAAELYRAALQKGGVDANIVNTRLGATLARAGQRAEAEGVLRSVTGSRAELARFWLLWLSRQG